MMRPAFWKSLAAAITLLTGAVASAQFPLPELTSVFPPGGKQGTSVEVTVTGNNLDDPAQLWFSHPGIKAAPVMGPADEFLNVQRPVAGKFTIQVAADVPAGIYEVRAASRFGSSNPRSFAVGNLNEVIEDGANKSVAAAKEMPLDTVINGRAEASSLDYYKVTLKAGQRLVAECYAERIDSKMNATLAIYSAAGKEIRRVRDVEGQDPMIDFVAPADGQYVVGVYDFYYGGSADHVYRLNLHAGPRIDFVFPPSGAPGSNGQYTVYGVNLPNGQPANEYAVSGKQLQKAVVNIQLPADPNAFQRPAGELLPTNAVWLDAFEYRLGNSNAVRIGKAEAPVIAEVEPNDKPSVAQKVTLPCEIVGQFFAGRDDDWFQFDAKKGDVYRVAVISQQMGLQTDPYLVVARVTKNAEGQETMADIAQVDDPGDRATKIGSDYDSTTDDPSYRFTAPDDGTYRVMVRDQFGSGRADPRMVYRLIIRPESPDFSVLAMTKHFKADAQNQGAPAWSPVVRRGGTTGIAVEVQRRDGFAGEVTLSVEGLPAGVTCPGAVVSGDVSTATLIFVGAEDAKAWAGPIKIVGKSKVGEQEVTRNARGISVVWGTANKQQSPPTYRVVREMGLSVMEAESAPALVQLGDMKVLETSKGGTVEVPVKVTRRGEFKDDLKLVAFGVPAELKPADLTIPGAQAEGKLTLALTNAALKPGAYTFYLMADAKLKYVRNPDQIKSAEESQAKMVDVMKQLDEQLKQLTAARDAAVKAAAEATAAANAAKDDAAKQEAAKAAEAAKVAAEQALKDMTEKQKRGTAAKTAADKAVDDQKKANAPKDTTVEVVSTPVQIRVLASPLNINVPAPGAVKQGAKVEVPLNLQKLFGFDDAVDLTLELPAGVAGLTPSKLTVAKGQADGKFELAAAANATVGQHTATIRAKAKFNNVAVESTVPVVVKVEAGG